MDGLGDKAKGKFEEVAGKVTGDHTQEMKGKARQAVGELKDKTEDMKDSADDKVNDTLDAADEKIDEHKRDNERRA